MVGETVGLFVSPTFVGLAVVGCRVGIPDGGLEGTGVGVNVGRVVGEKLSIIVGVEVVGLTVGI